MDYTFSKAGLCELNLKNQRALVTGASSGIGAAIAVALGSVGVKVAVNYARDEVGAARTVEAIKQVAGESVAVQADISDERQVQQMFSRVYEAFGSIDILINNAGIQKDAALHEMSLRDWQRVIDVNLTGSFLCAREAIREFLKRGIVPEISSAAGKIIFTSSVHETIPWAGHANYTASKGGVMLFMKSIAQEYAQHKIRINSIAPGAIKTDINTEAWNTSDAEEKLLKLIPYGRVGNVDDIAKAAVWLASDHSDYVTGATLYIDGGMTLYPAFREGG